MTDTALAPAAPAPEKPSAKLDDVMLAMDVVDTLRHDRMITERELAESDREEDLIERLRAIYRGQGIEVPDEILRQGVKALREERFTYRPPRDSLSVKLARLYVTRGRWGKWALGAFAALLIGSGWLAYEGYAARVELTQTIPAAITRLSADIGREAGSDAVRQRAAALVTDGETAARDGKAPAARAAVAGLERLRDDIRLEYDVRIVSRPGESTGVWRRPRRNPGAMNFYLIVEAIGRDGRPIARSITSEEDGTSRSVTKWGVRVPESLYRRVEADKRDDGIVQDAILGRKIRGQLEPVWREALPGGAILDW